MCEENKWLPRNVHVHFLEKQLQNNAGIMSLKHVVK